LARRHWGIDPGKAQLRALTTNRFQFGRGAVGEWRVEGRVHGGRWAWVKHCCTPAAGKGRWVGGGSGDPSHGAFVHQHQDHLGQRGGTNTGGAGS